MIGKEINVFSLWRNSEKYAERTLNLLEGAEKNNPEFNFNYFFFENDSEDDTVKILESWMKGRRGKFASENFALPHEGAEHHSFIRCARMGFYRNKMRNLAGFLSSDFNFVFDSDVFFKSDIFESFISKRVDKTVSIFTPAITQNIPCKTCGCGKDTYYDSAALFDSCGIQGLCWSCNPFVNIFDRAKYAKKEPINVRSAFGGFTMMSADVLNFCSWSSTGGCEHVNLCNSARNFGDVKVFPDIEVRVEHSADFLKKVEEKYFKR